MHGLYPQDTQTYVLHTDWNHKIPRPKTSAQRFYATMSNHYTGATFTREVGQSIEEGIVLIVSLTSLRILYPFIFPDYL